MSISGRDMEIFNHEKEKMRQLWRNGTCFWGFDFAGDSGSDGGAEEWGGEQLPNSSKHV